MELHIMRSMGQQQYWLILKSRLSSEPNTHHFLVYFLHFTSSDPLWNWRLRDTYIQSDGGSTNWNLKSQTMYMKTPCNCNMLQKHKALFCFILPWSKKMKQNRKWLLPSVPTTIHPALEYQDRKGRIISSSSLFREKPYKPKQPLIPVLFGLHYFLFVFLAWTNCQHFKIERIKIPDFWLFLKNQDNLGKPVSSTVLKLGLESQFCHLLEQLHLTSPCTAVTLFINW